MSSTSVVPSPTFEALGVDPLVCEAVAKRGFEAPTAVQTALLASSLVGRDVLVSSRTGSGKTVAFGLLLLASGLRAAPAPAVTTHGVKDPGPCFPSALVIAPTRELAQQVRGELAWLLEPLGLRVLAVTGGTSVVGELRALAQGADIIVGTPGRLNDHLTRVALSSAKVQTVVLDEADEMLDMGFRDELEAILDTIPAEHRTVMLSATMPAPAVALAKKYLKDPAKIHIEAPGTAHADIAHVAHVVPPTDKLDALVNLLLEALDERVMIFARTRADAGELADALAGLGFAAAPLTGEMAQRERTQTLDAFRVGRVSVLVATDVAARGLDVPEVTHVLHADLPGDAAALTHRSGRTGRAGRKGTSVYLVPPTWTGRAKALFREAGVKPHWKAVPSPEQIRTANEGRLRERLTAPLSEEESIDPGLVRVAEQLLESNTPALVLARLLRELRWEGPCTPRKLRPMLLPEEHAERRRDQRKSTPHPTERGSSERDYDNDRVAFRTNFGEREGATTARLLAMLCRRGNVRGTEIGNIEVHERFATFTVSKRAARSFTVASARPDPREPHIRIEPLSRPGHRSSAHR